MGIFSPQHILLALLIGLLLFGRKLPEIARSFGKTFTEFQKGMKGLEDDVTSTSTTKASTEPAPLQAPQRVTPPTQKPVFDDVPAQPTTTVPPKV
jgi:sec-independent protein translocase protein TatA